jgi:tRNA-dihydrouridine synthase 3
MGVLWRFIELLREHFGADERGRRRILRFLPWHLDFFSRYRPLPEVPFREEARRHPLLQTRLAAGEGLTPLESLLSDPRPSTHEALSRELLEASGRDEALDRASRLAATVPPFSGEIPSEAGLAEAAG